MINSNAKIFNDLKSGKIYDDVATAAKIARNLLKATYPSVKFSVRSSRYSMGSSFCVNWTDGPSNAEVSALISPLEGKGFDGSIDMAYSKSTRLYSDGTIERHSSRGTQDSCGYAPAYEAAPTNRDFVKCSFGCYVSTSRKISFEQKAAWLVEYCAENDDELSAAVAAGDVYVNKSDYDGSGNLHGAGAIRVGSHWADDAFYQFFKDKTLVKPVDTSATKETATKSKTTATKISAQIAEVDGVVITEHTHTKKGFQMYICEMPDRVEKQTFTSLLNTARNARGWYSRKWGETPAGFAFKCKDAATTFANDAAKALV